jgi:hypothetical protein
MNIYSIISLLLLIAIDKIHKAQASIKIKMSSIQEQVAAFFFSIISLETLMGIYNTFHENYTALKNKLEQSTTALAPIWWANAEPHYYTQDLKTVVWIHSPHSNLLWNRTQPDGVETKLERIPWLSAELYYGETKLADMSHWVMELHYRGWSGGVVPTADVILQAWAAVHGHHLHYTDMGAYRIDVIDDNGDEKTFRLGQTIA